MGWGNKPKKTPGILPSTKIKNEKKETQTRTNNAAQIKHSKGKHW